MAPIRLVGGDIDQIKHDWSGQNWRSVYVLGIVAQGSESRFSHVFVDWRSEDTSEAPVPKSTLRPRLVDAMPTATLQALADDPCAQFCNRTFR